MKKLFFASVVSLVVLSCSSPEKKEEPASKKSDEMKAVYEKNLAVLKSGITAFEKEDIDGWATTVADDVIWESPIYGDSIKTKTHYKTYLKYFADNWDNIKLSNAQFLPGLDSTTQEMDGSVRYYGRWDGTHKSGVVTHLNVYSTYDFNKDNKIVHAGDYYDAGGIMNAVMPKEKK